MSISIHTNDAIDQWILRDSLRIVSVRFESESERLIVDMNSKTVMDFPLNTFPILQQATPAERSNYILLGEGIGVHWPDLDEDLSLKGFLLADMKRRVIP